MNVVSYCYFLEGKAPEAVHLESRLIVKMFS